MANKPGLPQKSIGMPRYLWDEIEKEAAKNFRSVSGQIRFDQEQAKKLREAGK